MSLAGGEMRGRGGEGEGERRRERGRDGREKRLSPIVTSRIHIGTVTVIL